MVPRGSTLAMVCGLCLAAQTAPTPKPALPKVFMNPAFTEGALGEVPAGWLLPAASLKAGFQVQLVQDPGQPSQRCTVLSRTQGRETFGNLMQTFDATAYRGKRIRLRGALRLEAAEAGARGQLWLRVDRPKDITGFFDNSQDRPVTGQAWTTGAIVGDVAPDAEAIALGAMLVRGNGKLWIRPFTLEVLGDAPAVVHEAARALTPQGLENLQAFTRAFNYVRFFHPSDEAAKADWDHLARTGAQAVEGAQTPQELAKRLNTFFAPYAPTAQWLTQDQQPKATTLPKGAAFWVRWEHVGFGQKTPGTYQSTREFVPLAKGAPKGWTEPLAPPTQTLGAGVKVCLPSVCFADTRKATLPLANPGLTSPKAIPQNEPTGGNQASGDDRSTRLGDVTLAWGIFQHFFPYFDVSGCDWNAELAKALSAAALDKDGEAFAHTLRRMTASLKDGHVFVSASASPGRSVPSLGLVMVDGLPVVQFTGASAKQIPTGSRVLSIDGELVAARMARLSAEISAATQGWLDHRLSRELLTGDPEQPVALKVLTPVGLTQEAILPRDPTAWQATNDTLPDKIAELKPGLWYVDLDRIDAAAFTAALPKLAEAKGVVFDLRGYPKLGPDFLAHLTDKPLTSARWNKPIVTQPDGQGWDWNTKGRWDLAPQAPRLKGKVAFLTGGGAISYAESCLGIVEAYHLGAIVGARTAGTNGNINPFTLPGGYSLSWTGMKVLKHDGSRHHGVGILPTIPVQPTLAGLAEHRDEVLEQGLKAVEP